VKRAATLAAVLSIVACTAGGSAAAPSPRLSPSPVSLGEVRIGALFPTSGSDAAAGMDALRGAQLAVQVLDGAHPEIRLPGLTVGRAVLDPADTSGDPQAGAAAVDRLVGTDHVAALTGALQAGVTAAASQRAEQLGVPMVAGSASDASLTERSLRWFWRVGPSDRTYVQTAFDWLHAAHVERPRDRPIARVVVVHTDDQAGKDGATLVEKLAPADVQVTEDVQIPTDGSDLTPQVLRLDGYGPDAVIALAPAAVAIALVRTMARAGFTPPALLGLGDGFTDPLFTSGLGPLADYVAAQTAWSPEIARRNPVAAAVAAAFRQEFGRDMTADSARDFEATMTAGMAIQAAGSTDPVRVRAALTAMDGTATIMPWRGVRFDATGQNALASGVIEQIVTAQYHVVYPAAVASTGLVWPMPGFAGRA